MAYRWLVLTILIMIFVHTASDELEIFNEVE